MSTNIERCDPPPEHESAEAAHVASMAFQKDVDVLLTKHGITAFLLGFALAVKGGGVVVSSGCMHPGNLQLVDAMRKDIEDTLGIIDEARPEIAEAYDFPELVDKSEKDAS